MSTETLEFPPIEEPRAAVATIDPGAVDLAKLDLQTVALAQFGRAHEDVKKAVETLTGVEHDLSTPTKLAEAKSLRHRLIGQPLAEARKVSAALKSKLTAVSKAVGTELTAIETAFDRADKLISPQIEKREAEIAEERRIAAEKEAARVQAHRDNLAKIAGYVEHARGLPAARIELGIEKVKAIEIDRDAWQEFADQAEAQKADTLAKMAKLHADALADEERQRVEAALKAERERLEAERAEIERQRAELQAQKDAAEAAERQRAEEAARLARQQHEEAERQARELQEARQRADAAEREAAEAQGRTMVEVAEAIGLQQPTEPAPAPAPEVRQIHPAAAAFRNEQPTLSLGEIKSRIAPLSIDAAGLESMGFPATKVKASCMYRESDWAAMKAAMLKVLADAEPQQKAA